MRFFSGTRDSNAKKGIASVMYKKALNKKEGPKETQDEKYRKILDAKIAAIQNEIAQNDRKTFKLPGTVTEERKVSRHALEWMKVLAEKKLQKEMKKQRSKQQAFERDQRFAKKAEANRKKAEIAAKEQQLLQEQQAAAAKPYFFGYSE